MWVEQVANVSKVRLHWGQKNAIVEVVRKKLSEAVVLGFIHGEGTMWKCIKLR